jgi:F-type H+-transporting ATPase subunit delta
MASQLSSGDLISDRYASALYDLASEKKLVDVVLDDLLFIQSIIKNNKDLKLVIKSPLIKSNDKLEILQNILKSKKPNELSSTFLKVLSKNKRFQKTVDIISQFKNINAQKRGDVLADITSAEKLSSEQQDNIKEQLRTILGDKLSLSYKVDEQIIGGLIIKVGSKMIDTSLSNKINKLKIAMKGA